MKQDDFNQQLCSFLAASTTPFHAVANMVAQLSAAGFSRLTDGAEWKIVPGGRYFLTRNDSSIVAFIAGRESSPGEGIRMVG
ncbi:MAG: M18 family aminopeptidase, partial [Halioglobus sp.]|nr:M18 family aminopeptidase [Halioglobus sp.]